MEIPLPNHRPCNDQQGWQLTYLAAYLFATRGSLKPGEMDAVLSTTEPLEKACALAMCWVEREGAEGLSRPC